MSSVNLASMSPSQMIGAGKAFPANNSFVLAFPRPPECCRLDDFTVGCIHVGIHVVATASSPGSADVLSERTPRPQPERKLT